MKRESVGNAVTAVAVVVVVAAVLLLACGRSLFGGKSGASPLARDNSDPAAVAEASPTDNYNGHCNSADALLQARLAEAVEGYNDGTKTYAEAHNVIADVKRAGVLSTAAVDEWDWKLRELRSSKASFERAEGLFLARQYDAALDKYLCVSECDTNYEAARQKAAESSGYVVGQIRLAGQDAARLSR